jgi:hypothetical protein
MIATLNIIGKNATMGKKINFVIKFFICIFNYKYSGKIRSGPEWLVAQLALASKSIITVGEQDELFRRNDWSCNDDCGQTSTIKQRKICRF